MGTALSALVLVSGCSLQRAPIVDSPIGDVGPDAGSDDEGRADADAGFGNSPGGSPSPGPSSPSPGGDGDGDGDTDPGATPPPATTDPPGQPVDEPPPPEDFGLSCGGVTCPSVTAPADQCCTGVADVQSRRAREVGVCGIERPGVDGCVQLEQGGVLDEACPDLTPGGLDVSEPGCCTDTGRCGTFDAASGIGCHENDAVDEPCGEEVIDETVSCEPTGAYAIRAEVDVTWGGRSGGLFDLTDDGRGTIEVLILGRIEKVGAGNDFLGTMRPCRTRLPPFYSSILCESYQPIFDDAIWDAADAPEFDTTGSFQCLNPGCVVTFNPVTSPVGIELDDPDGAWPTASQADSFNCASGEGDACFPDQDLDGHPGITVSLLTSGTAPGAGDCSDYEFRGAPLNANPFAIIDGVVRSDRLHLGVRIRLGASGRIGDDCNTAAGLGVADFVESRAASCMLEPGTNNLFEAPAGPDDICGGSETEFMNENLPIYDILRLGEEPRAVLELQDTSASDGPRYELVRLGALDDDVSCADVRAAF
ncbi:MAG: hypothetical protein OXT09_30145 [Myxococcales bacterium]|nr:hypothetical protein [Myxococcales bacterium]